MGKKDTTFATKIFLYKGDKFLLLQKTNKRWHLPGGHITEHESPKNGLKREVYEETGITNFTFTLLDKINKVYLYKGKTVDGNIKLSKEHIDYKWIHISQVGDYDLTPDTINYIDYLYG